MTAWSTSIPKPSLHTTLTVAAQYVLVALCSKHAPLMIKDAKIFQCVLREQHILVQMGSKKYRFMHTAFEMLLFFHSRAV